MIRLGSVIAEFEADFLTQFRHRLSFEQLRALSAMRDCRSPASPMMQVQCEAAISKSSFRIPAAIAFARTASTTRASNGWNVRCSASSRPTTFC
jgi:hypothetical protein